MNEWLEFRKLSAGWADAMVSLILDQPDEYRRFFSPFACEEPIVYEMLQHVRRDVFMGLLVHGDDGKLDLAGLYMLRGWDAGYEIPAQGVFVAQAYAGRGLGTAAIEMGKALCRLRGCTRLLAHVYPDNRAAFGLSLRCGFYPVGMDGERIKMYCELDEGLPDMRGATVEAVKAAIREKYGFDVPDRYALDLADFTNQVSS